MPPTPAPPTALSPSTTLYAICFYSTVLNILCLGLFVTLAQTIVFFLQLLLLWLGCCGSRDEHEGRFGFSNDEEGGEKRAYTVDMLDEYVVRARPELLSPNAWHDAAQRQVVAVEPRDFTQCDESGEGVALQIGEMEPLVARFGTVPNYGSVGC